MYAIRSYYDAAGEGFVRCLLKFAADGTIFIRPYGRLDLRNGGVVVFFDQFQVAVAPLVQFDLGDFGNDPVRVG